MRWQNGEIREFGKEKRIKEFIAEKRAEMRLINNRSICLVFLSYFSIFLVILQMSIPSDNSSENLPLFS